MSSVEKIVTGNSLTPTLYKLCTYLSTAFVDKLRRAFRWRYARLFSTMRSALKSFSN